MRPAALAILGFALVPANPCSARGDGDEERGSASASVVAPLQIEYLRDLSFGAITVGAVADGEVEVVAGTASARYAGSVSPLCGMQATECSPHPARIAVRGEAGRSYRVDVADTVMATGQATGRRLVVQGVNARSRERPAADRRGRLDGEGRDTLEIGGTLRVPAATPPDHFRAELSVFVAYD